MYLPITSRQLYANPADWCQQPLYCYGNQLPLMSSHLSVDQNLSHLQALGFNAVRLLISFGSVFGLAPKSQARACASVAPADYQAYLTNPDTPVTGGSSIPDLAVCHPLPGNHPSSHSPPFLSPSPLPHHLGPSCTQQP